MIPESASGPIAVIMLAAGASVRLGQPKQLVAHAGQTLLARAVELALSLEVGPVFVVVGAYADRVRQSIPDARVRWVENADWEAGMGRSLRAGAEAALDAHPTVSGILVLVCDQPFLRRDSLLELVAAFQAGAAEIAAASYAGTLGVPAIFGPATFDELRRLDGQAGARNLIRARLAGVVGVAMAEAAIDIDTPEDLGVVSGNAAAGSAG